MNSKTNVTVVGIAGGAATIILWLLGFFQPELMNEAPTGLEAAITTVIAGVAAYVLPQDKFNGGDQTE